MQKGVFVKMHQIYVFYLYVVFNVPVYGIMYISDMYLSQESLFTLFLLILCEK